MTDSSDSPALDPVCGMEVDSAHPKGGHFIHSGRTYFFCGDYCRRTFAQDPEACLRADGDPSVAASPIAPAEPPPAPKGATYVCPMDPQVSEPAPGPCPFCGMALVARLPRPGGADPALAQARRRLLAALALGLPVLLLAEWGSLDARLDAALGPHASGLTQLLLALALALGPAATLFVRGWKGLRRASPNMYTLIAAGSGAALAVSVLALFAPGLFPRAFWAAAPGASGPPLTFEAGALILVLALLGEWLELTARVKAGDALAGLLEGAPKRALKVEDDGREQEVGVEELRPGDRVRVRPGEAVAADGRVLEGRSWVDESRFNGEAQPSPKAPGDALIGGSLNGLGGLLLRVERAGPEALLARVAEQVAEAQASRAKLQRLADRAAAWFVPGVVLLAALTFAVWALWGPPPALRFALLNALSVLLVACPCALGLAAPMSVLVGSGAAARRGVLFRDAAALEDLAAVDTVCLDKTGTLTEGKPRLVNVETFSEGAGAWTSGVADGREAELLLLAASVERHSEHPLGRAVVEAARERGLALREAEAFEAVPGQGARARVQGRWVSVGRMEFCGASGNREGGRIEHPGCGEAEALRTSGAGVFFVGVDGRLAGLLAVQDPLRPLAQKTVARLKARGLRVLLLSGDADSSAKRVGRELGLEEAHGGLSPLDKAARVRELSVQGRRVAFVGDGVNDAPALAEARVGLALGHGSDLALRSAPVTLLRGDVGGLEAALAVSQAVRRNIRQNLGWALGYNALGLPLAAGLLYPWTGRLLPPVFAAGAMSLSSLVVVGNALRLRGLGRP